MICLFVTGNKGLTEQNNKERHTLYRLYIVWPKVYGHLSVMPTRDFSTYHSRLKRLTFAIIISSTLLECGSVALAYSATEALVMSETPILGKASPHAHYFVHRGIVTLEQVWFQWYSVVRKVVKLQRTRTIYFIQTEYNYNFVATIWGRSIYGCDGQVWWSGFPKLLPQSCNFWPYCVFLWHSFVIVKLLCISNHYQWSLRTVCIVSSGLVCSVWPLCRNAFWALCFCPACMDFG